MLAHHARRFRSLLAVAAPPALAACGGLLDDWAADAISAPAAEIRVPDSLTMTMSHGRETVLMTRPQPPQPGDAARADSLLGAIEAGLAAFADIDAALAAGYRFFPAEPPAGMFVVHLVHDARSRREGAEGFDAAAPGSLLYERVPEGHAGHGGSHGHQGHHDLEGPGGRDPDGDGELADDWRLLGAMITAPVDATAEQLGAAAPLSATQWHLHRNTCVPRPLWDAAAWADTSAAGEPLYGPTGTLSASREDCEDAGGRMLETVFGWMTHAYVFAPDGVDPWDQHYGH